MRPQFKFNSRLSIEYAKLHKKLYFYFYAKSMHAVIIVDQRLPILYIVLLYILHSILQVPSANCRNITRYYAAIINKTDILVNKTYNSTDDRVISVGGLYPYTDYTLKVITTNDVNFTSETLEIFQTSQTSE